VVSEARKEAQATISEAKSSTQEEQNKKLAEVKAVRAFSASSEPVPIHEGARRQTQR